MSIWTCVACNENCERHDLTNFELEDLQGCYCPYADVYCEWEKDPEEDDESVCDICGETFFGFGNNPWPFDGERCCDRCNGAVIKARFRIQKLGSEVTKAQIQAILDEIRKEVMA